MSEVIEREFGWDDTIENDGGEFILLPEGDYNFTVVDFERGRHGGSAKLPPCNKATIHLVIESSEGRVPLRDQLFLHTKCEGMLCAFFTAIGQRTHGEKLQMNWSKVIGSKGRCQVGIRTWTKDNGETGTSNEVKKYYKPENNKPNFTPGAF